ncbi:MAG: methylated-DNA--[protein]-cysteine S-methyltransferase [Oceanicoccus sp.]
MRAMKRFPIDCVYQCISSPVGDLIVVVRANELHGILWESDLENAVTATTVSTLDRAENNGLVAEVETQLSQYFGKKRTSFDLPITFNGTVFQKKVWRALMDIPYGETASYQAQAERVGGKEKVRAVGTANGANPISIVVPCHRVIGKNGALTGYAGGISAKEYLLDLERDD